jgi:prolyl-tRNA synthetase
MRTRIFLRTSEFLWLEGHTAHAAEQEARERTQMMLDVYSRFVEDYLAIPVIRGAKTESERFPGAVDTLCIEAMMQDRKALQAGTSHFLGQNFAKSSDIRFQDADKQEQFAWTTSWGVSTRMIGGMIMTHGDDDGVIMPPRVAPAHIVLLPIFRNDQERATVMEYTNSLASELRQVSYHNRKIVVEIDERETGGARGWDWIKKGIPVRAEIGPKDIQNDSVFAGRRDRTPKEKKSIKRSELVNGMAAMLDEIQNTLFNRALEFRKANTVQIDDKQAFYNFYTSSSENRIHGGFSMSHWCGSKECEANIKDDLSVTIRCIPFNSRDETGKCIYCGGDSNKRVLFAKSY